MIFENLNIEYLAIYFWIISILTFFLYIFYTKQKDLSLSIPLLNGIRNYKAKVINFKNFSISLLLVKACLNWLSILFLWFILLWPRWWVDTQKTKAEWIDVMFALDVSNSMKAFDFKDWGNMYSRLDAAKYMIRDYVVKNNQNRYWLISFAWESIVSIPLTTDTNLFVTFLNWLNDWSVSVWWTDLIKAISSSLNRFVDSDDRAKIIILVSDWWDEDDDINYSTVKRLISENDVQIFTIWIWSIEWNNIPEWQDFFWRISYKMHNWKKVITKLYEYPLKKIASNSDWEYFRADSLSVIQKINDDIESLQKTTIDKELKWWKKDLYKIFVSVAFVLFTIWIFI